MSKFINYALFQLGWFLAVIFQTPWALLWAAVFIFVHLRYFSTPNEIKFLLPVFALGIGIDLSWQLSSVISFNGSGIILPYWLVALWLIFPLTLNHSLSWLKGRMPMQIAAGVIGGGGSYFAGGKLGAAEADLWGMTLVACSWAIWLPLFYYIMSHAEPSTIKPVNTL